MKIDVQMVQLTNEFLAQEIARVQHENATLKARLFILEGEMLHANGNDSDRPSESKSTENNNSTGK
ncbi:hypothetical protein [Bacillus sp. C1]